MGKALLADQFGETSTKPAHFSSFTPHEFVRVRANNRSRCLFRHEHRRHCFSHDVFLSGVAPLARSYRPTPRLYRGGAPSLDRFSWWTGSTARMTSRARASPPSNP